MTGNVSTVAAAMDWAVQACGDHAPVAAGIDAMLHWCDGRSGWRPADWKLRRAYPKIQASIMSPNGLAGSMAIGGMALALRLRERWPDILLNETHPKVLMHTQGAEHYSDDDATAAVGWFSRHSGLLMSGPKSGHQLDAVLSAWATREALSHSWPDLVAADPSLLFPAGPVRYFWPEHLPEPQSGEPQRAARPRAEATRKLRQSGPTTAIGFVNKNGQIVVRKTDLPGTDHGQTIYVLRCLECGHHFGANGSDIWLRRCPRHDGGAAGLAYHDDGSGSRPHERK